VSDNNSNLISLDKKTSNLYNLSIESCNNFILLLFKYKISNCLNAPSMFNDNFILLLFKYNFLEYFLIYKNLFLLILQSNFNKYSNELTNSNKTLNILLLNASNTPKCCYNI
jgi:hypothetical protein